MGTLAPAAPPSVQHCAHCQLPVRHAGSNAGPQFCCTGCATVWHLLHATGESDYYTLRERLGDGRASAPAPADPPDGAVELALRHVQQRDNHHATLSCHVSDLHCAACVWLLERLPRHQPGLHSARVDLGESLLHLHFDPTEVSPAALPALVARWGYRAVPVAPGDGAAARRERRALALRTAVAAAAAVGSMHLAFGIQVGALTGDLDQPSAALFGWATLLVTAPSTLWAAWPIHRAGWLALRAGRPSLDTTASAAVLLALVAGVIALLAGSRAHYFDAAALFVAALLAGRLAFAAAAQAVARLGKGSLGWLPQTALRIGADGHNLRVPISELRQGDVVQVAAGAVLPCDGHLHSPRARVDASVLTGEAHPVTLTQGEAVSAGTRAWGQSMLLVVSATGNATRLGALLAELRRNSSDAAPQAVGGMIDRLQAWFAPAVLLLALGIGALWWCIAPHRAMEQALAVVLVSCPCALGLAAPLVAARMVAAGARHGVWWRDASSLERLNHVDAVILDKTGTLTEGRLNVQAWHWHAELPTHQRELLRGAVAELEAGSLHPVAQAIAAHLAAAGVATQPISERSEVAGAGGASASCALGRLTVGSQRYTGMALNAAAEHTPVAVCLDGRHLATIVLGDSLRAEAPAVLAMLARRGITVHLCSGDRAATVQAVAARLGVAAARTHAEATPHDKAALVQQLRSAGHTVAMIGDGINDGAALQAADVGLGVRGAVAAVLEVSHAYLHGGGESPLRVAQAFEQAGFATRLLHGCLGLGLAYNAVGIAAVAIGWWGPLVCAISMPLASLSVVLLAGCWPLPMRARHAPGATA